jgi:hypothetical protein
MGTLGEMELLEYSRCFKGRTGGEMKNTKLLILMIFVIFLSFRSIGVNASEYTSLDITNLMELGEVPLGSKIYLDNGSVDSDYWILGHHLDANRMFLLRNSHIGSSVYRSPNNSTYSGSNVEAFVFNWRNDNVSLDLRGTTGFWTGVPTRAQLNLGWFSSDARRSIGEVYWTRTSYGSTSVYTVSATGVNSGYTNTSNSRRVRPVMYLTKNIFVEGLGGGEYRIHTTDIPDFTYRRIDNNEIEIVSYGGSYQYVAIPSQIGGRNVSAVGNDSFNGKNLDFVKIPETITNIGRSAFRNNNLQSIILPIGIKTVNSLAFANNNLSEIKILNPRTEIVNGGVFSENNSGIIWVHKGTRSELIAQSLENFSVSYLTEIDPNYTFGESQPLTRIIELPLGSKIYLDDSSNDSDYWILVSFLDSGRAFLVRNNHINSSIYHTPNNSSYSGSIVETFISTWTNKNISFGLRNSFGFWTGVPTRAQMNLGWFSSNARRSIGEIYWTRTSYGSTQVYTVSETGANSGYTATSSSRRVRPSMYLFEYLYVEEIGTGEYKIYFPELPDFEYEKINATEARIVSYNGSFIDVNIPTEIEGHTIVEMGSNSFQGKELREVVIPNSVRTVGSSAFSNNSLKTIKIPESITTIGSSAFRDNNLETITIPQSVTTMGDSAFRNNKLTEIILLNTVIGSSAFRDNNLETIIIPNSVTSIGASAFSYNNLKSVVIADSVQVIGSDAFRYNNLTEIAVLSRNTSFGNATVFADNTGGTWYAYRASTSELQATLTTGFTITFLPELNITMIPDTLNPDIIIYENLTSDRGYNLPGDRIKITAPEVEDNTFLAWRDINGNTISRRVNITFVIKTGETQLIAVYGSDYVVSEGTYSNQLIDVLIKNAELNFTIMYKLEKYNFETETYSLVHDFRTLIDKAQLDLREDAIYKLSIQYSNDPESITEYIIYNDSPVFKSYKLTIVNESNEKIEVYNLNNLPVVIEDLGVYDIEIKYLLSGDTYTTQIINNTPKEYGGILENYEHLYQEGRKIKWDGLNIWQPYTGSVLISGERQGYIEIQRHDSEIIRQEFAYDNTDPILIIRKNEITVNDGLSGINTLSYKGFDDIGFLGLFDLTNTQYGTIYKATDNAGNITYGKLNYEFVPPQVDFAITVNLTETTIKYQGTNENLKSTDFSAPETQFSITSNVSWNDDGSQNREQIWYINNGNKSKEEIVGEINGRVMTTPSNIRFEAINNYGLLSEDEKNLIVKTIDAINGGAEFNELDFEQEDIWLDITLSGINEADLDNLNASLRFINKYGETVRNNESEVLSLIINNTNFSFNARIFFDNGINLERGDFFSVEVSVYSARTSEMLLRKDVDFGNKIVISDFTTSIIQDLNWRDYFFEKAGNGYLRKDSKLTDIKTTQFPINSLNLVDWEIQSVRAGARTRGYVKIEGEPDGANIYFGFYDENNVLKDTKVELIASVEPEYYDFIFIIPLNSKQEGFVWIDRIEVEKNGETYSTDVEDIWVDEWALGNELSKNIFYIVGKTTDTIHQHQSN